VHASWAPREQPFWRLPETAQENVTIDGNQLLGLNLKLLVGAVVEAKKCL
jgi:hypothetical protein